MIPLQSESLAIWQQKYQLKDHQGNPVDLSIDDTFRRVAKALAAVEATPEKQAEWEPKFYQAMLDGAIPAGRILSNAGAGDLKSDTSLINCTVANTIHDSMHGILEGVYQAGMTLKKGSGIGYCFSTLRPRGAYIAGAGAKTSGPLSFMDIYDKMCFSVASAGGRRGAQMATFDVGHPDIEDFIKAKREDGRFRQFNCSVLVDDAFMEAVEKDEEWPLSFPMTLHEIEQSGIDLFNPFEVVWRPWPIHDNYKVKSGCVACKIYRTVRAKDLWDTIMRSTYEFSEPGVLFIDRINQQNNNQWCENIQASNPCFTGDTKVWTDEGAIDFKTLVEKGKDVNVLTEIDGKLVYRKMFNARMTRENSELVEVEFTNGTKVRCTPDHVFYLKNGQGIEAKNLDYMMPLESVHRDSYKSKESGTRSIWYLTVYKVRQIETKEDVYCGTVDEAGKFFVAVGDLDELEGVLVSNCGEQVLPPNGACLLGSINLTQFVRDPFTSEAYFDWDKYRDTIIVFTRMLDNVVELNGLPLKEQRDEIISKRRHGMGYMGLGSAMAMLGIRYGSEPSTDFTEKVSMILALTGWEQALALSIEKGPAPCLCGSIRITDELLDKYHDLGANFKVGDFIRTSRLHAEYSNYMRSIQRINPTLIESLATVGARFTHHSSIAPTGTLSLSIGNNCSNGIEPSFSHHYQRNVIVEGRKTKEQVSVYSYEQWAYMQQFGADARPGLDCFITADQLTPKEHIDVQAAAQYWIDSSISKTVNCPSDISFDEFKDIYQYAYDNGLKGVATFRFNPEIFQGVLVNQSDLENTTYRFVLDDGQVVDAKGNEQIEYDGAIHTAANLYDAIHDGYYGKL